MRSNRAKLSHTLLCICIVTFQSLLLNAQSPIHSLPSAVLIPQSNQADTALQQGRQLLRRGQGDQALGLLETALNLYTAAKNSRGVAAAHNELGDLYLRQGQNKVALDHYQKAYEAFSGAHSEDQKNETVSSSAATRLGGASAGKATETAASLSDNGFNANLMLAKIGETNFRLGRLSEATAAYTRMKVKKPEGAASRTTRRFGGLGGALGGLSTGKVEIAAPVTAGVGLLEVTKELSLYRDSIVYSAYELGLGRVAFFANDLETARQHFQNAFEASGASLASVAKLGQARRARAAARTSLADVVLRQGKYKDAAKLYEDAAKGAKDDKRLDLMWPAQRGLGRSLWMQATTEKDKKAMALREKSIENYRSAIETLETLRQGSIRADEARTTFLATTKDVFDEAATALAEMAILSSPSPGAPLSGQALQYAAEALKVTEQARARSLLDLLAETNAQVTEGVPAELLKSKQANLEAQQELAQQLVGINVSADAKKKPSDIEGDLEKLQTEFDTLENQIRTASPKYAALTAGQPLSLAEVQQRVLDDHTALLEYSLGTENSYLWVVTQTNATLLKLPPRAAIEKLAMDFRAQLIPSNLQRRIVGIDVVEEPKRGVGVATGTEVALPLLAVSNALYKAAVEPAAAIFGDKRLLIVADGALNYVPFEALVTSPATVDFSAAPYLVKTNEIVYAPSASVIAAIRQQATKGSGRAVLIVADPVFNSRDTRARTVTPATTPAAGAETRGGLALESAISDVTGQDAGTSAATATADMRGLRLARLPGTRTEADAISKLVKTAGGQADVWLDLNASEESIESRDINKYRVIHIATHGLLNADRPQFTGVVLSLIGNKSADGFLRTDEVFNLRLGAPLVMLSACETGLGKEKRGEGVLGLTRAFLYAGAPTVGVSLWSVADKSTADLMTEFYRRLLASDGVSSSAAMREAQLSMITGKKYAAPFFWAPFVLVGDWR